MFVEHCVGSFCRRRRSNWYGVGGSDIAPQEAVLLVVGGMLICLVCLIAVTGFMGWAPG